MAGRSLDSLSPDAIVQAMADALPTHGEHDTTSDLSTSYEALALFTHACMRSLGFRLLRINEDQRTEADCRQLAPRLPSAWNATFNSHTLTYASPQQSGFTLTIKVDRIGPRAEVRGIASGTDCVARFDVAPRDYVSSAAMPLRISRAAGNGEDRSDLPTKLLAVFESRERIADLAALVKDSIVAALLPDAAGLQKAARGSQAAATADADDEAAEEDARQPLREAGPDNPTPANGPPEQPDPLPAPARPYPYDDPLAAPPRRPHAPVADFPPPDFEDEHQTNRPRAAGGRFPGGIPLPGGGVEGGPSPFGIGHDDLYPPGLGPNDPLRGGLPQPGRGGGGMHPTFDDPLFGGSRGEDGSANPFDPQVPPGARYDPVGPGAPPYGRRPFGGSGGGGSPFGGGFGGGIL